MCDAIDWIETVARECKMGELSDDEQRTLAKFDDAGYSISENIRALMGASKICNNKNKSTQNVPMSVLEELYGSVPTNRLLDAIEVASSLISYSRQRLSHFMSSMQSCRASSWTETDCPRMQPTAHIRLQQ